MHVNLYKAKDYVVYYEELSMGTGNFYYRWWTSNTLGSIQQQKSGPVFDLVPRRQAARLYGVDALLNFLAMLYNSNKFSRELFCRLKIDCIFSNGHFNTVDILNFIDIDNFPEFCTLFPDQPRERSAIFGEINNNSIQGVMQALIDNRNYKKLTWLLLYMNQDLYQQAISLGIETKRLKMRSATSKGLLFQSRQDINCLLLSSPIQKKMVIDLSQYKDRVFGALARDKNYNEKISSTDLNVLGPLLDNPNNTTS